MKNLKVFILGILATMFFIACNNTSTPPQPQKYSIEYELNGGAWIADYDAPGEYTEGEEVTLPDAQKLTRTGSTFAGWYETETFTGTAITTIAKDTQGNKKFYAKWNTVTYSITLTNENKPLINGNVKNGWIFLEGGTSNISAGTNVYIEAGGNTISLITTLTVKTDESIILSVTKNGNLYEQFVMPAANVTIDITILPYYRPYDEVKNIDDWPFILFGEWPQTKLTDTTVMVNENDSKEVGQFTYYKGSDNAWYAKLSSDYYKVEPIKWGMINPDYNQTGKRLFFAENILLYDIYYDGGPASNRYRAGPDPNNYEHSRIRAVLNGLSYNREQTECETYLKKGFLYGAFTEAERDLIVITSVKTGTYTTNDKIFLLSKQELDEYDYYFRYNQN